MDVLVVVFLVVATTTEEEEDKTTDEGEGEDEEDVVALVPDGECLPGLPSFSTCPILARSLKPP